jgi:uncharacterized membrane protein
MKSLLQFLRTTFVGGILFLVPIIVLGVIVERALVLAGKVMAPVADRLPVHTVIGLGVPLLLAVVALVLFCFLAGFFARTALAQRLVNQLEGSVLSNLPGYYFLKGTGESMLGVDRAGPHPVVLARFAGSSQLGFQIEALENGLVAVFIPNAPDPHAGTVHFLAADRVTPLAVSPGAAFRCLKRLGAGSRSLLAGAAPGAAPNS